MGNVFNQRGNTKRLMAGTWPAPSSIRMVTTSGYPPANNYVLTNFGPNTAFVGYGGTSATAITNARIPSAGDAGDFCFILPPGQRTIEAQDAVYFAAVTESGTADIFITPGQGSIESDSDTTTADNSNADLSILSSYESGVQQELLQKMLIELRTITEFLKQGLNVADDPDSIRGDQTESIN